MTEARTHSQIARLCRDHGTPLYVYHKPIIQRQVRRLQKITQGADLYYSLKANPNTHVVALVGSMGCKVEVASKGEMRQALSSGYKPDDVLFIGPGKTRQEISEAHAAGVRHFVCDSTSELDTISQETNIDAVTMRVNPEFTAKGGKLTMSGGKPKQFGVASPEIPDFVKYARHLGLRIRGLHYYLGTRFLNESDIISNTRMVIDDADQIARSNQLAIDFLDMGGGFGIPYFDNESFLDLNKLEEGIQENLRYARECFPQATLAFESGRFLTAECGYLALSVVGVKKSYGTIFGICDGGTNLNLAAIGTGSLGKRNFPNALVKTADNRPSKQSTSPINVTGPLCTPDDTLLKNVTWKETPEEGDLVILSRVGAYGPSAAPHGFLGHEYPTEILTSL